MPRRVAAPAGDARTIAHDVLVRVATTDAFADLLLAHRLDGADLAEADRALATGIVYGTLAWQGRLDHHLATLVRHPLPDLEAPVLASLRLGLYQILFLDRVPSYAAVDASVRLVERSGPGAKGLVNAVLRRASNAGKGGLPLPPASDSVGRMAVEWSHPRWLAERWADEHGLDALPAVLAAHNRPAPTTLRANAQRTTRGDLLAELAREGIDAREGRFASASIDVSRGSGRLRALPAHREGRFTFQGEASQLVAALVDVAPSARVLDACAAPGGKTLAVAEGMASPGRVVALDPSRHGLVRIAAEGQRLGTGGILAVGGDARRPPLKGSYDAILVDAPCSGLGTLRQHPELRWRRKPDDIPRLATLQGEILAGVAPLVGPGGLLVYAVCTRTPEETTGVLDAFTKAHPRFVVEPLALPCVGDDGLLRTSPHEHGLDGFFAVRLRARRPETSSRVEGGTRACGVTGSGERGAAAGQAGAAYGTDP